jgi:DNA-binding LacI/PurR family transcriptional regulator/biotin operon repressor
MRQFSNRSQQVAEHLRSELLSGRWRDYMPGVLRLERELGVNRATVESALRTLEEDGLLVGQGAGKRRRVVVPEGQLEPRSLLLRYLPYEKGDTELGWIVGLSHMLEERGFRFHFARQSLSDLGMNPRRVAALVKRTPADAWIVAAGSLEVLSWFAGQSAPAPALALFGRFMGLPIAAASPRKTPALQEVVRRLVSLGHRRIVMLVQEERRKPHPAAAEQAFLDELKAHGIETGSYNLPDWGSGSEDFHRGLDRLFTHTPPTAMIIMEPKLFSAAQDHLARRGVIAPRDVSLVCDDPDPTFEWRDPPITHLRWDSQPLIRRVARWADNIARGKEDLRQTFIKAEFVEGGTIGPVPKGR